MNRSEVKRIGVRKKLNSSAKHNTRSEMKGMKCELKMTVKFDNESKCIAYKFLLITNYNK